MDHLHGNGQKPCIFFQKSANSNFAAKTSVIYKLLTSLACSSHAGEH